MRKCESGSLAKSYRQPNECDAHQLDRKFGGECAVTNRKINRVRIFELAAVYLRDAVVQDGPLSFSRLCATKRLAALAYGPVVEEQWGTANRNVDFFDVKADLENLFAPKLCVSINVSTLLLHPVALLKLNATVKSLRNW